MKQMTTVRLALVFVLALYQPVVAFAQTTTTLSSWEKYLEPVQTSNEITPYTFNSFGESTSLQDGSTSFSWTDIDIKGNNALPVRLQRSLAIEDHMHGGGDNVSPLDAFDSSINLDIPHLEGTFGGDGWVVDAANPNARCTLGGNPPPTYGVFLPQDYWSGNWMHIPWVGKQEILRNPPSSPAGFTKAGSAPLMTKNMWAFECLSSTKNLYPGEGFVAISPSGEKYFFDWVVTTGYGYEKWTTNYGHGIATMGGSKVYFFVTRIEDRFGNYVTYTYDKNNNNRLSAIDSSDGRYIHVTGWVNGAISTVQSSMGTWHYSVSNTPNNEQFVVTLPDQSQINYLGTGSLTIEAAGQDPYYDPQPDCMPPEAPIGEYEFSVELPSGAMADYQFSVERHAISNVPKQCNAFVDGSMHSVQYLTNPNFHDGFTLFSKTVSGPGLPTSQWTYSYPSNGFGDLGAFKDVCDNPPYPNSCPLTSTTIVHGPGGSYKLYKFGQKFKVNSGQLLSVEEGYTTGTAPNLTRVPLRTTQNTYVSDTEAATAQFPAVAGSTSSSLADTAVRSLLRPLKATSTTQDGVTFTWEVPSTCNGNNTLCFDLRARPRYIVKSNTLGYKRTEYTTYSDNATKWVLGLVTQVQCVWPTTPLPTGCGSGTVMSETTYDSTYGLPLVSKAFGKTQQTLAYDTTSTVASNQLGTLKSIKDGRNNVTTLTNWYRGIPRTITYPATDDQQTPVTMKAIVDDAGRVTAVTDQNGYSTGYGYDDMGRLATIVYPTGDSTNWNTTYIDFSPMTTGAYGLGVGHWRRTEHTGNGYKVTDYDALWRPVVENQYDSATSPRSITVKRYDESGRLAFQSYPMGGLSGGYTNPSLTGMRTFYDALDRVTKVEQDAEDSTVLTTLTTYLTGFKTQVTNPRNFKTITSFMAFDQPTTDWPVDIDQADGKTEEADTDIARDVFGKPLAITRHNPSGSVTETRSYVYDVYQLLCKTVEPETGPTLVNYDAANNVDWSASDQSLTTLTCDRGSVDDADKVKRTYDARNRLKTLRFPDQMGDQDLSYTPDSLPAQITTYNAPGHTRPLIDSYHYNKRRMPDGTGESLQWPGWYTWSVGHGYDSNGHLSVQIYPDDPSGGLQMSYAPNALGQPTQAGTFATDVTYWPNGAIKQFTYGNGIVHTMTQNERQLPETSKDAYGGTSILYDSYVYDANGNVATILDGATGRGHRGDRSMEYDALDRLMSTDSPMFGTTAAGTGTVAFTHDVLDNLINLNMPATDTTPARNQFYCYDTHKRLTSLRDADGCAGNSLVDLTYDVQGNLATKGNDTFTFGDNNRLYFAPSKGELYYYDAQGHRTLQNASAGNILSQYSQDGQLLQITDNRSGFTSSYISLGGSLVAVRKKAISGGAITVEYQHTDALGTPVAVTNASRAVIERSEYEPYGQLLNRAQHDGPGFTGHVQDAMTGLTYMQQRYYDPMIGRFLSVDPVTATSVGGNFNRYWYGNDNPYNFKDPDGRMACTGSSQCLEQLREQWKQSSLIRFAFAEGGEGGPKASPEDSTRGSVGSRLLKAIKVDVGVGPGIGAGFRIFGGKLAANAHAVIGISFGGKSGFEGFAEREAYIGGELGRAQASFGFDSVRYGNDPEPIRQLRNEFSVKGAGNMDSSGLLSTEASLFLIRVKVQVDPGGVLFAFFGPNNGWEPDGIQ
ncbi:MAG: RHS repeat-associated core domain-containing protein [Thermomonas sp.]